MWKIYREIRDTNNEEEQALKNGGSHRRTSRKNDLGRTPNRSLSPTHRVLTSIKRADMIGFDAAAEAAHGEIIGQEVSALHLPLDADNQILGIDSDDDDLDQGSRTVRKHMRATRRALGEAGVMTARDQHEPGKPQLGHEEFKVACKQNGDFPSALILEKIGDEASGRGNTEVNLSHQGVNFRMARSFSECLKVNTFIKTLKLKDNVLGTEGVAALCLALKGNYVLSTLDLGTNSCGPAASEAICEMLHNNSYVTELSLSNNKLDDQSLADILEAVKFMSTVVSLNLSHNHGNKETGVALRNMLSSGNEAVLTSLDLSWNKITHIGAIEICEGLKHNEILKVLHLSWNSLGDEAGRVLGRVLGEDKVLESLDLSNCKLLTPAMREIAQGLEENKTLHRLVLDKNYLGLYAGKALLRAIITQDKTKVANFDKCILVPDELILSEMEQNYTGHYTLDCTKESHLQIAEFLAEKAKITEGNCWRNEMMNGVPFSFPWYCDHLPDKKWMPPVPGKKGPSQVILELDVISTEHPAEDEESVEMFIFDYVVHVLEKIPSDVNRIQLVRMLSLACFFRTQQVERLIEIFPYRQERVNVAVYFYNRVIDHCDYVDMLLAALGPDMMQDVARRIGPARVFNEEEPDGHYRLMLSKKEDRELFVHLVELAAGDDGEPDHSKCCFAKKLNATEHRVGPEGELLPIFEEKIEEAAPPEEPEPLPEGAPVPPPKIEIDGESELMFQIPEQGILEFDYVGA